MEMTLFAFGCSAVMSLFFLVTSAVPAGAENKPSENSSPAERLLAQKRPLVIAHRGYSLFAPENTAAAFHQALLSGADLVELDYHHSSDGVPVVIHDAEVDRTTDGKTLWGGSKIRVDSRTAAELQTLDAGKWFKPPVANQRLPLLTESLDQIQKSGVTLIERKAGDAATCIKILREKNLINQVVVQAFDWKYLADFNAQEPQQILAALGPSNTYEGKKLTDEEKHLSPRRNSIVKDLGAKVVVWNKNVEKEAVEDAHRKGLKVWVYTIDDPLLASKLLDLGVDGIISNNPAIIWKVLAERK
jgi:glycerophosphoryl diester phosphodiesterase